MSSIAIIGLPVITRSNVPIGHVGNVRLDPESLSIVQYCVCARALVHRWTKCRDDRLVHVSQVVRLESTHLVVEDLLVQEDVVEKNQKKEATLTVAPVQSTMIRQERPRHG